MITKEQLQSMSDFQRNVKLFELLGGSACRLKEGGNGDIVFENGCTINYHNTPNDIMPLAFEYGVGFAPNKDSWEAFTLEDNYQVIQNQFVDGSPLRAISCCLILVLQERKK